MRMRVLAPVLALCGLLSCTVVREPESVPSPRRDQPDQIFLDARVELQEDGQVRGAISARRMEQVRRRSTIRMRDSVEVVSWDSLGRVESLTLCDTLLYRRDRQDMSAGGNVRMMAAADPQGRRLREAPASADLAALRRRPPFQLLTRHLDWVQRIHKVQTEAPVVFYTPLDTLYGVGFSSDRKLRNWEIKRPTGVTHRMRSEERPRRREAPPATAVPRPPGWVPGTDGRPRPPAGDEQ